MHIDPFHLERWQSIHEHQVEINLSDSGVHPVDLSELLDRSELDRLMNVRLGYTQTNGTPELREVIAALHPGATVDDVEVVNGGSEANFIALWSLLEPGDEVVVMLPNYMQIPGLVRALGATVTPWWMQPDVTGERWTLDLDELDALITDRTKLVAICNPNNPTGACLAPRELDVIGRVADKYGVWVLSDEIYRGSELDGNETATVWGRTERPIVTGSLSKTYGLPGLRLGWILAPAATCAGFWAHHDYTTIAPAALSDAVATQVLRAEPRRRLLSRTRSHLRANYALVETWMAENGESIECVPPNAGAMAYLRSDWSIPTAELAQRLLDEKSVLLVPGEHYMMAGWIRVGFGGDSEELRSGLERVSQVLDIS